MDVTELRIDFRIIAKKIAYYAFENIIWSFFVQLSYCIFREQDINLACMRITICVGKDALLSGSN